MDRKSLLYIALDSIFLVVFNTVFFVVGGAEHPVSVWISYAFMHIAYLLVLATPFLTHKNKSSAVFGFSLYSISAAYFLVEFVIGLIFVLISSESYKAALVVQIIIAGIYAVLLLSNLIANESTSEAIEKQESEVDYIKTAASRVKLLLDKADDKKVNKEIERVYDLIHSSPSKSSSDVKALEIEITNKISALEGAVKANSAESIIELAKDIIKLTEQRNESLKLLD